MIVEEKEAKILIRQEEVEEAMRKMAKDKAMSVDGISDTIFKKTTWENMWFKEDFVYEAED